MQVNPTGRIEVSQKEMTLTFLKCFQSKNYMKALIDVGKCRPILEIYIDDTDFSMGMDKDYGTIYLDVTTENYGFHYFFSKSAGYWKHWIAYNKTPNEIFLQGKVKGSLSADLLNKLLYDLPYRS